MVFVTFILGLISFKQTKKISNSEIKQEKVEDKNDNEESINDNFKEENINNSFKNEHRLYYWRKAK